MEAITAAMQQIAQADMKPSAIITKDRGVIGYIKGSRVNARLRRVQATKPARVFYMAGGTYEGGSYSPAI